MGVRHEAGLDALNVALAALADTRKSGVIFVGPVGSGKTFAVRGVVTTLSNATEKSSVRARIVTATSTTRDIRNQLRQLNTQVDEAKRDRPVIVGDDLDTWPPTLLRMLANALDRNLVQLIGSVRENALQQVLGELRPSLPPVLVPLEPWTSAELTGYAQGILGAPLDALSASRLVQFCGGNPLCLVELLDYGLRASGLRRQYETWSWAAQLEVPPITQARVGGALMALPPTVRQVLLALTQLGHAPLQIVTQAYRAECIDQAEAEGLIDMTSRASETVLSLRRPLEGRVLWSASPTLCRRDAIDQIVESWVASSSPPGFAARLARSCLNAASTVPAELAAAAATDSAHVHDEGFVIQLADLDVEPHAARELRVGAMIGQFRLQEAAVLVAGTPERDGTAGDGHYERAAMLSALARGATNTAPRGSITASIYGMCADAWTGDHLQATFDGGRALLQTTLEPGQQERCLVATVSAGLQLGRIDEALAIARLGHREFLARFSPGLRLATLSLLGLCHLLRGGPKETLAVAAALSRMGLGQSWPQPLAAGRLLSGRCALIQARPRLATRRLSEVIASASPLRPQLNIAVVLESLALAYVNQGRLHDADIAHDEASRERAQCVPHIARTLADLTRAEVLYLRGGSALALELCLRVANEGRDAQRPLQVLLALHLMARVQPSTETAVALAAAARQCDFALAGLYAQHAQAAAGSDGAALAQVARDYDDKGLTWLAAETAASALATIEAGRGAPVWSLRAKHIVAAVGDVEPVSTPEWWGSVAERIVPLTNRERQIAHAVVLGGTSAQIATQLQLSSRTVENHVQHIYQKLGISRRQDLADSLGRVDRAFPVDIS